MGRKKTPHYRIVVADSTSPRDGRFVETLGHYKPLSDPARLVIDIERVDHWLNQGADPSRTVRSLISKARRGGDATVAVGEEDHEERQAKRAEELAARRAREQRAAAAAAAGAQASPEAATETVVPQEPGTGEAVEPEAGASPAAEARAEAEAAEATVGDVEEAVVAESQSEPAADAGADAEAGEAEGEEKSG
jgi:small subunit ribosomal protein S16